MQAQFFNKQAGQANLYPSVGIQQEYQQEQRQQLPSVLDAEQVFSELNKQNSFRLLPLRLQKQAVERKLQEKEFTDVAHSDLVNSAIKYGHLPLKQFKIQIKNHLSDKVINSDVL